MVMMVGAGVLVLARVVVYGEKGRMKENIERTWEF